MNTSMAHEHPFQVLFETLGRVPTAHAESVNRQAYEILSDILTVPVEKSGRCILLRAPRAGHGKTHLLSRIQHQLGASHEFVPLQSAFGCRIDAASVTNDTLRRLVRQLPASGGLTVLDLVTRRLFASALQPLVASGEVPCQDREGALTALRTRPIETFDFNHPNAVTAHWAKENFEVLGQRLSLELAQRSDLPVSGISFWVNALFQFASAPLESSNRVRMLLESVHAGSGMEMERLEALLGLVTLLMRVVLVADDLEGFSTDETAALRLAAFLGALRQSVERLDVILSLNQDIWQNAFMPRLSGGLADRLSEVVVELEPLTEPEMEALLNSRVPGLGRRVLDRMNVAAAGTHARGLIRAAGVAWLKATAMDSVSPAALATPVPAAAAIEPPVSPVVEPEPVAEPSVSAISEPVKTAGPAVEWPEPVFTPPAAVEIAAEPLAYQAPLESPFQSSASVPIPEPVIESSSTLDWQEPSQGFTPDFQAAPPAHEWAPAVQVEPAAPNFVTPVDSPFQGFTQQAYVDPPAATEGSNGWNQTLSPPPAHSAAPHEAFIVPVTEYAPVNSPFQNTPPPPPPHPAFEWQQPAPPQGNFAPPLQAGTGRESFFESSSPPMAPEPQFNSFNPPSAQQEIPVSTPFSPQAVASPAPYHPVSEPIFNSPPTPAAVPPPPTPEETDRVDDLLRQFRERYGRGSL
jgi:hypothetical protein